MQSQLNIANFVDSTPSRNIGDKIPFGEIFEFALDVDLPGMRYGRMPGHTYCSSSTTGAENT
jgi:hypothetical protein